MSAPLPIDLRCGDYREVLADVRADLIFTSPPYNIGSNGGAKKRGYEWEAPAQRLSKNGNSFVVATVKVKDGDDSQWVKILAFGTDAQAELKRLDSGEAVAARGSFKCDVYTPPNREPRVNMTIFADAVLPLRQPPKPKKPQEQKPADDRAPPDSAAWDDPLPSNMGGPDQ